MISYEINIETQMILLLDVKHWKLNVPGEIPIALFNLEHWKQKVWFVL